MNAVKKSVCEEQSGVVMEAFMYDRCWTNFGGNDSEVSYIHFKVTRSAGSSRRLIKANVEKKETKGGKVLV